MSILDDTRFVESPQFFSGQRLFASDLQDLHAFNREMRWLHNASLHQVGIGSGFAVSGRKGDRSVQIGAGYAIDARGREIVLTQPLEVPVPPVEGEDDGGPVFYDIAVAYPQEEDLEEVETRDGVCLPRGAVRLREQPRICWIRLEADELGNLHAVHGHLKADLESGMAIVLARAQVLDCRLERDISIAERRSARQLTQPHVAAGVAEHPGWTIEVAHDVLLMSAHVDTTAGKFSSTPAYWARMDGEHTVTFSTSGEPRTEPLPEIVQLADPTAQGFVANVLVLLPGDSSEALKKAARAVLASWKVVWLGVER